MNPVTSAVPDGAEFLAAATQVLTTVDCRRHDESLAQRIAKITDAAWDGK